jgi:protein-S-isoprenylcysteine O-methyltransferase Ste14
MLLRMTVQLVLLLCFIAVLLFLPAATLDWPQAWAFLAEMGIASFAVSFWLARHDPGLLRERMESPFRQKAQVSGDRIFMSLIAIVWFSWVILMALDVKRWHLSNMPVWLNGAGAAVFAVGFAIVWLTFRANSFAAPVVKIQKERGQTIITTGPYGIVRHPMYAGATLYMIGMALLLGSWIGLAVVLPFAMVLSRRIGIEERTLREAFPDYADYAARVHYRLIPGVW